MDIVKTKSFELAVYRNGDENAPRMALVLPGRLDTKDYPNNPSHVDFLASRGYFALTFDPPGTWESPGGIELYTVTNYLKAINELIEYFGNKPTVLMGHSRGGSMAMLAGTRNEHVTHIIAVLSNPGPSKIDEAVREAGIEVNLRDLPPNNSQDQKRFDLPFSYFEDALQYGIREDLIVSKKPKLFFTSPIDEIVSSERALETYVVCQEPMMIHELNVEHDYRRHGDVIEEVNRTVGDFLDAN